VLTDVTFWQPGGHVAFKALDPGELFLFKLHSPNKHIVVGGFFATSSLLPVSIAWETCRETSIRSGHNSGHDAHDQYNCWLPIRRILTHTALPRTTNRRYPI
jgi:hypothetical protein